MKPNILILGGSSSIAKELIKLHNFHNLYYSYHSGEDTSPHSFYLDLFDKNTYKNIPPLQYNIIYSFLGYTPAVELIDDLNVSKETIERNFLYPSLLIQDLLLSKRLNDSGRIKIITSVAGIRGRKSNFVYGASKAAMQTLIEGLANKYSKYKFTDIVLGPVYTDAMPIHNTPRFLVSEPKDVAVKIFQAKKQRVFVPVRWRFIMLIIWIIPNKFFNNLNL